MKKLLIFLGGLVSGFGLGLLFEELKDRQANRVIEVVDFKRIPDESKKAPHIEKPELDQLVKRYRTEESNYEDYSKTSKDDISEDPYPPEDFLSPEEDEADEEPPEVEFSTPQIIPRLEFENEKTNYEVQTLMYYAYDDTVCDENEQVISSPEDLIGDDALVCFGLGSDDPNTVYICNDKRGTKYEVIKVSASYQEQVLGFVDKNTRVISKFVRREDSDTD